MTTQAPALAPAFLADQRIRLLALKSELGLTMARAAEATVQKLSASQGQANESEDLAQDLAAADTDRTLLELHTAERTAIDRALSKLDEGTYGQSDLSGLAIPMARLRAYPQAALTISEEAHPSGTT